MVDKSDSTARKERHVKKQRWYWTWVAIIIVIGVAGGHWLNEKGYGFTWRCWVYQCLHSMNPFHPKPHRTVLVLVGDDEYWKGEAEGRTPIKRDYLAKLVRAADAYNSALIALDFDLRSPSPDGNPVEFPIYQSETQQLLEAVKAASHNRTVVLPKTLGGSEEQGYVALSDIYNGFDFEGGNVRFGYIALPDDTREVPPSLPITDGAPVNSFSQAIARADYPKVIEESGDMSLHYGSYANPEEFSVISAQDLLSTDPQVVSKVKSAMAFKLAIIGGRWHTVGYNSGPQVDSYDTPVGNIPGVFIHANYTEAMLNSKIFGTWKAWVLDVTEAIFALAVACAFALKLKPWWKNLLAIALPYLIVVVTSYISLVNFGYFFDPFIPLIMVGAHGAYEQISDWRTTAHRNKEEESEERVPAAHVDEASGERQVGEVQS